MMYLIFKELASSASDVIMVTQSIMKDTAEKSDVLYKANAIRALCRVIDVCVAHVVYIDILKLRRQPPYKQLNGRSRTLSLTRILPYPPPPSFPHTIYFQLLGIWSEGGRVRLKKQHPRPNHQEASLLVSQRLEANKQYSRVRTL